MTMTITSNEETFHQDFLGNPELFPLYYMHGRICSVFKSLTDTTVYYLFSKW